MENYWTAQLPKIIQGGMGVNISGWSLARAVSRLGQLGTVSGVALDRVMAFNLQLGDPGDHFKKALTHFPFQHVAQKVLAAFSPKNNEKPVKIFRKVPIFTINPADLLISLTICANFAFVYLAKEDHNNPISINYLEKVAMPHIYAITGAMLAGVDFITMGAGIPMQIPKVIENIAEGRTATYRVPIIGQNITYHTMEFNPTKFFGANLPPLKKPGFLPIISSNLLASLFMAKLPPTSVQGFIVERPSAGGHNALPRKLLFDNNGELIYGEKDKINFAQITDYGLPWWCGGALSSPESLKWARSIGATGIQVGSIFGLSDESNMSEAIKSRARYLGYQGKLKVKTDSLISPTGFPFKVAQLEGSISNISVYEKRRRVCDQGALTNLYKKEDGAIGYRCSAEPTDDYARKGGNIKDTIGRGCLCNGLFATCRLQTKTSYEPPLVTLGEDLNFLPALMTDANSSYSAKKAIEYLLLDV